jgi:hypothetical protein
MTLVLGVREYDDYFTMKKTAPKWLFSHQPDMRCCNENACIWSP